LISVQVSPSTVWNWVQLFGKKAMDRVDRQLKRLEEGELPEVELFNDEEDYSLPLLIGADGVMVPFRNKNGKGRTIWREIKVAILARFKRNEKKGACKT